MMVPDDRPEKAVLLLAKSAFAAGPHAQMQRLAAMVAGFDGVAIVRFAFTEQGTPSLRDGLAELVATEVPEIAILPLMLPLEPNLLAWLKRSLGRWQAASPLPWPTVTIGGQLSESPLLQDLLSGVLADSDRQVVVAASSPPAIEGSVVPAQKRRVLVCQGGPCNAAGAEAIWVHLRNEQRRLELRTTGEGTMTAKSTCLGPCNLAPVMQVFPEGTYYGGVTEEAIDRIVADHLLGGRPVSEFAYEANGRKQRLRHQPLYSRG